MSNENETMKHNVEAELLTTNGSVQHHLHFWMGHPLNTAIKPWKNGSPSTASAVLTH